jgi:hypothetical protein
MQPVTGHSRSLGRLERRFRQMRIPREIMKGKRVEHIVLLAIQALAILKELHPVTGHGHYVFPKLGDPSKTMGPNTLNNALRTLGYTGDETTGHGFRTVASTLLTEDGSWRADAIERQLSHQENDEVRGAYNAAEYLAERRRMMQRRDCRDRRPTDSKRRRLGVNSVGWVEEEVSDWVQRWPAVACSAPIRTLFRADGGQCSAMKPDKDPQRARASPACDAAATVVTEMLSAFIRREDYRFGVQPANAVRCPPR